MISCGYKLMVCLVTLAISQTIKVSGMASQPKKRGRGELERICKEASVSYFEFLPRMYVDGRGETTKSLSV